MNELISQLKPQLLFYSASNSCAEQELITNLAQKFSWDLTNLVGNDFSKQLGNVLGLPNFEQTRDLSPAEYPQDNILWFVNVEEADLRNFLTVLAKYNEQIKIKLKAVLTEHNITWLLIDHYEELVSEHRLMQGYTFYQHAVSIFESYSEEDFTKESLANLGAALKNSELYIQEIQKGQEPNIQDFEASLSKVKLAYQNLRPQIK